MNPTLLKGGPLQNNSAVITQVSSGSNWTTDEGIDHDQHNETQEENQDIGPAAGEIRLGPHCINRQRHLWENGQDEKCGSRMVLQ